MSACHIQLRDWGRGRQVFRDPRLSSGGQSPRARKVGIDLTSVS